MQDGYPFHQAAVIALDRNEVDPAGQSISLKQITVYPGTQRSPRKLSNKLALQVENFDPGVSRCCQPENDIEIRIAGIGIS